MDDSFDGLLRAARGRRKDHSRRTNYRATGRFRTEQRGRHVTRQPLTWTQWGLRTATYSVTAVLGAVAVLALSVTS